MILHICGRKPEPVTLNWNKMPPNFKYRHGNLNNANDEVKLKIHMK